MWTVSVATGKRMPLDPVPVPGGNVRLLPAEHLGAPPRSAVVGPAIDLFDDQDDGTRYVSHFATCPNADEHRRR